MGRHEEMQAQHAGLRRQALGDGADREAGTVAAEQAVRAGQGQQFGKQGFLEHQLFRDAFDQQAGVGPVHLAQLRNSSQA